MATTPRHYSPLARYRWHIRHRDYHNHHPLGTIRLCSIRNNRVARTQCVYDDNRITTGLISTPTTDRSQPGKMETVPTQRRRLRQQPSGILTKMSQRPTNFVVSHSRFFTFASSSVVVSKNANIPCFGGLRSTTTKLKGRDVTPTTPSHRSEIGTLTGP